MTSEPITVAILTQYFWPEIPGTAQIATDLALGLKEDGFDVSVYTGQPAYVESERLPSRGEYRGLSIHRAFSRRLTRNGTRTRLSNGATVAAGTLLDLILRRRPDVILVDSTSPFLLLVAWLMRRMRGAPYVFLVHDVYPQIAVELGVLKPHGMLTRPWKAINGRVYSSAERIVVLGPRMKDVVKRSLREDHWGKLEVIPNWADGDTIVPRKPEDNPLRQELGLADKLVVIYSGNMGLAHDVETLVEAADRLRHMKDVHFLFIGGGGRKKTIERMAREKALENVTILPYQPQERLPLSLTCGDISVVTLKKGMEGLSVPSKLYSSLAAGLAIVAVMGPDSEVSDVVDKNQCGYRVSQGDVDGLIGAIKAMHDQPGLLEGMRDRARACFEANFTRRSSIERHAKVLRSVAGGARRSRPADGVEAQ